MRRNLRLDWRALALLGALLSFIIAWPGLVFAMPALTISNQSAINLNLNNNHNHNNYNNSNLNNTTSRLINMQSDHSHSSRRQLSSIENINNTKNYNNNNNSLLNPIQSISVEFKMRTLPQEQQQQQQQTAIATTATPSTSTSESTTSSTTDNVVEDILGFILSGSSSEHLAILSRTERSIRHQHQQHHHHQKQQQHQQQQQQQQQESDAVRENINNNNKIIGSKSKRLNTSRNNLHNSNSSGSSSSNTSNLDRNERSTVSHLAGAARKIQLFIKNRFIQLLRDGTVNGTQDEQSEYTILQRSTVDVGQIKIQSVATCLYLCMDACGAVYGSKDFTDDCVFNENMEEHNYNTYSSTFNSNSRRVYYLALNRRGEPRKTQIPPTRSLGKLATYTNAITETVTPERVEHLIAKNFGSNRIKHGVRQLCDTGKPLIELTDSANFKARPQCNPNSNTNSSSNSNSNTNTNNSSSSINISSSSSNQTLSNNVPAAIDRAENASGSGNVNRSSSSSLISISSSNSSQSESGHISGSNQSYTHPQQQQQRPQSQHHHPQQQQQQHHQNQNPNKKKKKLRKCRPYENEHEHNCSLRTNGGSGGGASGAAGGPGSLRKRGTKRPLGPKHLRCKELREQAAATGGPPPNCGGTKRNQNGPKRNVNGVAKGIANAANKSKKKKEPKQQLQQGKNRPDGSKKRLGGGGGNGGGKRSGAHKLLKQKPKSELHSSSSSTTTMMPSSLMTPESSWESSSPLPALSLSDTSDRVERNVRMSNSMELHGDDDAADDASNESDDDGSEGEEDAGESQSVEESYEDGIHAPSRADDYDPSLDYFRRSIDGVADSPPNAGPASDGHRLANTQRPTVRTQRRRRMGQPTCKCYIVPDNL